jgi:outer membrane murein-binding lipoprotein Lpp
MDVVNTFVSAAVVTAVGLLLAWLAKGRFDAVEKRIEALGARIDGLQASVDAMRSDLTHVALAVGARPRAENA